ncbi:MAG TPA: PfkB family carbohydrate kinase [Devosia sp.]|jgi:fructokinase|uniref:carbohydrate kinase family protein n=1 Tax=Devosia sp. TaxID=1871048 RepID=UPI002DDD14CA|nr:PfkB family carbohydrate kinase [Devosia sp.]HEV2514550.1 PfkB family carbohydrate kinase [Devosia sp.]
MFVVGGESLIDLISEPVGADGVIRLVAHQGGSPYNCAIALSKLGNDTGFLCPISTDGLGTYLLAPLAEAGVKPLLAERVDAYTTLAVVTFDAKKSAQYGFYRNADRAFSREGLIAALPDKLEAFQVGGFCPIEAEDAAIWLDVAREAARRGATLTMDPNVRPSLVPDFAGYKGRLSSFLDIVNLVKVSIEDVASLDQNRAVRATELTSTEVEMLVDKYTADFLGRPNCELVIVTFGDEGSRAFTKSGATKQGVYPAVPFGDTVGAGDTLMAAVLTLLNEQGNLKPGKLGGMDDAALSTMLRFGAVAAGLNCQFVGCHPPTRGEVDAVLAKG